MSVEIISNERARRLAKRWAAAKVPGDVLGLVENLLRPDELADLLAWVQARMGEQKDNARWQRIGIHDGGDHGVVYDCTALAYVVGLHLGGDFEHALGDANEATALCNALCERAGWPS